MCTCGIAMATQHESPARQRIPVSALALILRSTLGRTSASDERRWDPRMSLHRIKNKAVIATAQKMPMAICVICQPY